MNQYVIGLALATVAILVMVIPCICLFGPQRINKKKVLLIGLLSAGGLSLGVWAYVTWYNSDAQKEKRAQQALEKEREGYPEDREEARENVRDILKEMPDYLRDRMNQYSDEFASMQSRCTSDLREQEDGWLWDTDLRVTLTRSGEEAADADEYDRMDQMQTYADTVCSAFREETGSIDWRMSYWFKEEPEYAECFEGKLTVSLVCTVELSDSGNEYRMEHNDRTGTYTYFFNGQEQDMEAIRSAHQQMMTAQEKEEKQSGGGTSPSYHSSRKHTSTKTEDPYNARDYYSAEDFYDDYYDDFDDLEDAEAYYDDFG